MTETDGLLPMSSQKHLSGYKQGSGICCECCNTVVSPSQFEAHAGCASRRKPYDHIFTPDNMFFHEISVKMSTEHGISGEQRDEICSVCKNVGREMSSSKEKVTNKRELLFAIESQLEIGESLSRLRTRKRVVESYADKEDHDEDNRRTTCSRSKKAKVVNDGVPKKLKELLQTGLLEGLDVWYLRGLKLEGVQISYPLMHFAGTSMLHKLLKQPST